MQRRVVVRPRVPGRPARLRVCGRDVRACAAKPGTLPPAGRPRRWSGRGCPCRSWRPSTPACPGPVGTADALLAVGVVDADLVVVALVGDAAVRAARYADAERGTGARCPGGRGCGKQHEGQRGGAPEYGIVHDDLLVRLRVGTPLSPAMTEPRGGNPLVRRVPTGFVMMKNEALRRRRPRECTGDSADRRRGKIVAGRTGPIEEAC